MKGDSRVNYNKNIFMVCLIRRINTEIGLNDLSQVTETFR